MGGRAHRLVLLAGLVLLTGCDPAGPPPTARQRTELRAALEFYGIAKGVFEVASITRPEIAFAYGPLVTLTDPIVAAARAKLDQPDADPAELAQLTDQLKAAGIQVERGAAPAVTVVPNK